MTEYHFIERHRAKWQAFEQEIREGMRTHPDRLSELYITLIDDLSYARTHYPGSSVTAYLNQLAVAAHHQIYGTRREKKGRFRTFFRDEIPNAFVSGRRFFLYALLIFGGSIFLGWVSGMLEPDFLRMILGDEYVNQTLERIDEGNPMGVYGETRSDAMFLMISINNVRVAFIAFLLGIFGGIPTALLLLQNGMMVGAFLQFFQQHDLLGTALTTIMLHGAMELTAIVISGGCGLMLGSAVLFPGTYARGVFLRIQSKRALKILIGAVPFIVFAALIESYITRLYQDIPSFLRIALIFVTLILMLIYLNSGSKSTTHESDPF